jgi:fructoselysine-6-P-deglycase FrlB-like protein
MSQMLQEIRQQPEALERTLRREGRRIEEFKRAFEKRRPRLIVLVARGTSDNAARFGRYLLEIATGIPVSLAAPSIVSLYGVKMDCRETLVVALSQSGESTDTNLVLERAREWGALTLGITNERRSTLARLAERTFLVHAGREKSVAATKTYTGQMLMFYLLAYALGGAVRLADLERLPQAVEAALRAGNRGAFGALPLHASRRGGGARVELRQCLRVVAEADGNLLRGDRALLFRRSHARADRHGGNRLPGVRLRAAGRHLALGRRRAR